MATAQPTHPVAVFGDAYVAGAPVVVNFTPHLIPMSRGELCTSYVRLQQGASADDLRGLALEAGSAGELPHRLGDAALGDDQRAAITLS